MNWKGVFPAVTTKFHQDGSLDMDMFFKNLEAQVKAGVHGIILGGTLGESSVLSLEEKMVLTKETIKELNGQLPVILNIAEGATQDAIFWAHKAEELGASGLMLLPPMRYAADARETVTYFKAVAKSTRLPIMIYNNPVDYKTLVTLPMFEDLLDCENIQAVKESTRDISNVTRMINKFGDRYNILCGVDTLAMEELLMGASGWVAGLVCAFPKETVAIYNLLQEGKIEEALKIYRWFLPLLELDIHPKLVQYIKLAEQMAGIGTEYVRAPRLTLVGEERIKVENIIKRGLEHRPII
ncbi:dihydrodipicolinate synthase [Rhodonellum psychrophilum GCM71 = DSM 17998]|uniref:Dihydrodipicolinate synthase n=2 Tax=Rhodonellum TaxID=336827 RepID=U5C783_9BACT|nr:MULTISPECIES: dihydrodipicolinate synthase family protein [Rhodonellum]ERM84816.1 dihydrodipicolinate synthase [Rhodonellum psychrophilum GCM71 = DSM 17998]MDO9553749.1 dihydrodipicolinate synthase family protein [Rhodonellum sp.]SDY70894.1 4-hydroxy-tetrahydrodipicolinate synthase [Rhodonellum ikkaensis]